MDKLKYFSDETKDLISSAHDIALNLGDNVLKTIHLLLADCILNGKYTSREFFFKDEKEFEEFYKDQRVSEGRVLAGTPDALLVLSEDTKLAIRNSLKEMKKFRCSQVLPFHIFLAISKFDDYFVPIKLKPKKNLYLTFVDFYKQVGYLPNE